ncbi:hypothetical protein AB4851_14655 [Burkholderia sp. 22PA0099]|uniref:hypothetical protein n=1 Tax=Burkholderia sp. 22PA0099 TaxID=3237372 RepID=UPI0039C03D14
MLKIVSASISVKGRTDIRSNRPRDNQQKPIRNREKSRMRESNRNDEFRISLHDPPAHQRRKIANP